jgi:poly-beta-1,6-N-acetyl-D-glucosamine synthase
MNYLLVLSIASLAIGLSIYIVYFVTVVGSKKRVGFINDIGAFADSTLNEEDIPKITILIPAHNEEETLNAKIENISRFKYPLNKIKVIVLDDFSNDKTVSVAENAYRTFRVQGEVFHSDKKIGVNGLYNIGFNRAQTELILTTDADALLMEDTLLKSVKIMLKMPDVGGIAAKMTPTHKKETPSTRASDVYTDAYYTMLESESAIYSTYPGGSSCMLVRKSAYSAISENYGSSDGNISLTIIRNGFKLILAPCVPFLEPMSQKFSELRRQKVRRATRLLQSANMNRSILFSKKYGQFGLLIFPLRFFMMTIVPPLLLLGIILFPISIATLSLPVAGFLVFAFASIIVLGLQTNLKVPNLVTSFLLHQTYLLEALIFSRRKMKNWAHIRRNQ